MIGSYEPPSFRCFMTKLHSTTSPPAPGTGPGWERLAQVLREVLPVSEIDRIWAFRVVRREGRDFGTAILSRLEADRRRIYTARFILTVKGPKRGTFEWALDELLALVPQRSEEEEPPIGVPPVAWFPGDSTGS